MNEKQSVNVTELLFLSATSLTLFVTYFIARSNDGMFRSPSMCLAFAIIATALTVYVAYDLIRNTQASDEESSELANKL